MPLTRYQIRNEYSLADPELFRAADKDDPEALLEGVAMAGLVGILRQLGDLAEFAAEIFHDLHEEVMVTAARGHGLMVRVQQLEAEFPSIEKAFLSQTSHMGLVQNAGMEWHPNLQMEQNMIARGDLPRFIMDSYEECRGPPRLFLLDKFDIAGAGACLKRYTDPSFFKAEAASSGIMNSEIQLEKKTRKVKKKGSRWKHGETPEVSPASSYNKLHQLFLEERVENDNINHAHRRKLKKRQLLESPLDSNMGKSYMEKFLETAPPVGKVVPEFSDSTPHLRLTSSEISEAGLDIIEIGMVSPKKELSKQNGITRFSHNEHESVQNPSVDGSNEVIDGGIIKRSQPNPRTVDGYHSDDVTSEIDNYVDALATMEPEMETDTESRPKDDLGFLSIRQSPANSDANEEHLELQARFSDSQSIGHSAASDDGNGSTKNCSFKNELGSSSIMRLGTDFDAIEEQQELEARFSDSLATMESEMETDTESRPKDDLGFLSIRKSPANSDANGEHLELQAQFSDSQLIRYSAASDDGNGSIKNCSFKNELGSSSIMRLGDFDAIEEQQGLEARFSDSRSVENSTASDHGGPVEVFQSDEVSAADIVDTPLDDITINKKILESSRDHIIPNGTCIGVTDIPNYKSEFEAPFCNPRLTDSSPEPLLLYPGSSLVEPEVDEMSLENVNTDECGAYLGDDLPCTTNVSDVAVLAASAESYSVGELNGGNASVFSDDLPCNTNVSDVAVLAASAESYDVGELDGGNANVFSDDLLHLPDVSNPAPEIKSSDKVCQTQYAEQGSSENLVDGDPPHSIISSTDELPRELALPLPESFHAYVPHDPDVVAPNDSIAYADEKLCRLDHLVDTPSDDYVPSVEVDLAETGVSHSEGKVNIEGVSSATDIVEKDRSVPDVDSEGSGADTNALDVHVADIVTDTVEAESAAVGSTKIHWNGYEDDLNDDSDNDGNLIKRQESSFSTSGNLHQNGLEIRKALPSENVLEAHTQNEVNQSSELCDDVHNSFLDEKIAGNSYLDDSTSALTSTQQLDRDLGSESPDQLEVASVELNDLHDEFPCDNFVAEMRDDARVLRMDENIESNLCVNSFLLAPSSNQSDQDPQSESLNLPENLEDTASTSMHYVPEPRSPLEHEIELRTYQVDLDSLHADPQSESPNPPENLEDTSSTSKHYMPELRSPLEHEMQLRANQVDSASLHADDESTIMSSNQESEERLSDYPTKSYPSIAPSQPQESGVAPQVAKPDSSDPANDPLKSIFPSFVMFPKVPQVDMAPQLAEPDSSDPANDPLKSIFPSFVMFPKAPQADMEEMPPLPPLPPVQWRMGRIGRSLALGSKTNQPSLNPVPQFPPSTVDDKTQTGFASNPYIPVQHNKLQHVSENVHPFSLETPTFVTGESSRHESLVFKGRYTQNPFLIPPPISHEKPQHNIPPPLSVEDASPSSLLPEKGVADMEPQPTLSTSGGETVNPTDPYAPPSSIQDVQPRLVLPTKPQPTRSMSGGETLNPTDPYAPPPSTEDVQSWLVLPASEQEAIWSSDVATLQPIFEDGKPPTKLPRPRDPLIEAVAAHDRSTLRKVTERARPEIGQKVDERDSLLEQIRAKSFSLKPAVLTRPSIQGPKTNLKVSAILEKANAIRQALAGSDEDEDTDTWE